MVHVENVTFKWILASKSNETDVLRPILPFLFIFFVDQSYCSCLSEFLKHMVKVFSVSELQVGSMLMVILLVVLIVS